MELKLNDNEKFLISEKGHVLKVKEISFDLDSAKYSDGVVILKGKSYDLINERYIEECEVAFELKFLDRKIIKETK
ncbi:hypothetical protein [Clostridium sp.]|uniref:hypothetical protein n=1 Tax=Clostridium sp. TaxID=1506 RepID=UPI003F366F0D